MHLFSRCFGEIISKNNLGLRLSRLTGRVRSIEFRAAQSNVNKRPGSSVLLLGILLLTAICARARALWLVMHVCRNSRGTKRRDDDKLFPWAKGRRYQLTSSALNRGEVESWVQVARASDFIHTTSCCLTCEVKITSLFRAHFPTSD